MAKDHKQPSLHRRKKPRKIVRTYGKQISRCEEMVRSLSLVQSSQEDNPTGSPRGRLTHSAPNQFHLHRGVLEEHIRGRAWSGIEYLRSNERMPADKPTDDKISERLPDSNQLTPEGLCEVLRTRGYGDPRVRMVWADSSDHQLLPDIRKRRKKTKRIPYYMEKIRGQARTEFDSAAKKAKEFCDEEIHRVAMMRRAKVNAGLQMLLEEEEGVLLDSLDA
ncbi:hypothetical protein CAPTEDRAFT_197585 [Capitella teleta]|uniref:Uncharacterized protein n=1 Tax=Capitella teleta TaxID=283909 RepID=R7VIU2_CAPTE|nr:hypothetical protein CAPTEDRAFT_197585 [Capitella teleta]|eukprot:ELU18477.1 hypothetical protein CAPTEDRAFT_197585 [Capitella teleta]